MGWYRDGDGDGLGELAATSLSFSPLFCSVRLVSFCILSRFVCMYHCTIFFNLRGGGGIYVGIYGVLSRWTLAICVCITNLR